MREWNWSGSTLQAAAAYPDLGAASSTHVVSLFTGTWVFLGILAVYALLWAFRWRQSSHVVKHSWWIWLGWGLVLIASVYGNLWAAYFLGSGAVAWTVPTLAAMVIPLFVLWYQQTSQVDVPMEREHSISASDSKGAPQRDADQKYIGTKTATDLNRQDLALADLRKVISVVSQKLNDKGQIDTIVAVSNIGYVSYPTGRADARQLWTAVFEAVLDEPPATLVLLMDNIRDSLGTRSRSAFENALRDAGLS